MKGWLGLIAIICIILANPSASASSKSIEQELRATPIKEDDMKVNKKPKVSNSGNGNGDKSLRDLDQTELAAVIQDLYLDAVMNMDERKTREYGGYTFFLTQHGSYPIAEIGLGFPREKSGKKKPYRSKENYPNAEELQIFAELLPYRNQAINPGLVWIAVIDEHWTVGATISTLEE